MRARQPINSTVGLGLLAVAALVLVILQTQARGQVTEFCLTADPTADADGDGFSNGVECDGIAFAGREGGSISRCLGTEAIGSAERNACVDPRTPDLFVIIVGPDPADPNRTVNIPANPLEFIFNPRSLGGLGIAAHRINQNQALQDRTVTAASPQKAVNVIENLNPEATTFGVTPTQGTPNDVPGVTVFTQKIIKFVDGVYDKARDFQTNRTPIKNTLIKQVIAHEGGGHDVLLGVEYNPGCGEWHYCQIGVIMDQTVSVTTKGRTVTWSIPIVYAPQDQAGVTLK